MVEDGAKDEIKTQMIFIKPGGNLEHKPLNSGFKSGIK